MNVAIVEDDIRSADILREYILKYGKENSVSLEVFHFASAEEFLKKYRKAVFSVIFLDIDLPGISGMDVAGDIREADNCVPILFVTKMAQYAQKGYSVNALDFLLKPINYADFSVKMKKAINVALAYEGRDVLVTVNSGFCRISTDKLVYVEVMGHQLKYRLTDGEIEARGSLTDAEAKLGKFGFLRCNSCYLVNARFIDSIRGNDVYIAGYTLKISHPRRKAFMQELMRIYTGEGKT